MTTKVEKQIVEDSRNANLVYQNGVPKVEDGLYFFCYEDTLEEFGLPVEDIDPFISGPPVKWQFSDTNYYIDLNFNNKEIIDTEDGIETAVTKLQWNDESSRLLIEFYKEYKEKVDSKELRSVKKMWEIIAQLLEAKGYLYTPLQIENRWKTLERAYKRMVVSNTKSGFYMKHCAFEKELEDILKDKVSHCLLPNDNICEPVLRKPIHHRELIKPEKCDSLQSPQKLISELEKLRQEINKKEKSKQRRHEERMALLREQNQVEERKLELFEKLLEKWS